MASLPRQYEGIGDDTDKLITALKRFGLDDDSPAAPQGADEAVEKEDDEEEIRVAGSSKAHDKPPAVQKKPKSVKNLLRWSKHTVTTGDGAEEHVLTSWKIADYAYKRDPCPFPTRARGLFTETTKSGKHRIVCRAYDKFFNVNEVSWTKVSLSSRLVTGRAS